MDAFQSVRRSMQIFSDARFGPSQDDEARDGRWKIRFMFVEKLSKRCCITLRVLYKYSQLRWSLAQAVDRVTE
jgi:hypothetical protein